MLSSHFSKQTDSTFTFTRACRSNHFLFSFLKSIPTYSVEFDFEDIRKIQFFCFYYRHYILLETGYREQLRVHENISMKIIYSLRLMYSVYLYVTFVWCKLKILLGKISTNNMSHTLFPSIKHIQNSQTRNIHSVGISEIFQTGARVRGWRGG